MLSRVKTAGVAQSNATSQRVEVKLWYLKSLLRAPSSLNMTLTPYSRYLQELQREVQQHRRSSSLSNAESRPVIGSQQLSPVTASTEPPLRRPRCPSPGLRSISSADLSPRFQHPNDLAYAAGGNARSRNTVDEVLVSPAPTTEEARHDGIADPSSAPPSYHTSDALTNVWSWGLTLPSQIIKNTRRNKRNWIWLSAWSTWSFTFRLALVLGEKLHPESATIPQDLIDPDVYELSWSNVPEVDMPDVSGLPSLDHAIYLFNTVKFHLGQTYRLFDETGFENEIRDFYADTFSKASDCRLWMVKFLIILAYGTAFHAPQTSVKEPPGAKFFTRAMAMMPDTTFLWKDSLLGIEVLALAGLYLFSIDDRESGYIYLGQAIRIAQLEGLHTQLPDDVLGSETTTYCRDLWWTLYIMDRHFSSSVGLPMSIQNSDVTALVPPSNVGSASDSLRSLQVNLSHLQSVILTKSFLEQTRSILHTLVHHAQEIERIIHLKLQNSVGTMPRGTRYLTMLYHQVSVGDEMRNSSHWLTIQCVILATRPLLLSLIKERLDALGHSSHENWATFLDQTAAVISTGIKSAVKTLHILIIYWVQRYHHVTQMSYADCHLEPFLPYDLEFCFGAALQLTMAETLFPNVTDYDFCHQTTEQIFESLISRGNRIALARRAEYQHVRGLCLELMEKAQQQGHPILSLASQDLTTVEPTRMASAGVEDLQSTDSNFSGMAMTADPNHPLHYLHPHVTSNMEFLDTIGISSEDFLSIVQQIGDPETLPETIFGTSQFVVLEATGGCGENERLGCAMSNDCRRSRKVVRTLFARWADKVYVSAILFAIV
ncbi:Proline utilization trans-activator [Paramyrothecium foliicola]|nr:Proline utilization trans-activator [Paramyrothecium foliicola]